MYPKVLSTKKLMEIEHTFPVGCQIEFVKGRFKGKKAEVFYVNEDGSVTGCFFDDSGTFKVTDRSEIRPVFRNTEVKFVYYDLKHHKKEAFLIVEGILDPLDCQEVLDCCGRFHKFVPELVGFPPATELLPDWKWRDQAVFARFADKHCFPLTWVDPSINMTAGQLLDAFRKAKGSWIK